MVSNRLLRAFLDDAWDATPQGGVLRDVLRSKEAAASALIQAGSQTSVSANGRNSQIVAQSQAGAITQVEVVEAWRRLIDALDEAATTLGCRVTGEDDNALYNQLMVVTLREVTGYTTNFMYLSR